MSVLIPMILGSSFAQDLPVGPLTVVLVLVVLAMLLGALMIFVQRFKKCPPNRIMVVYGKAGGQQKA